MNTSKLKFDWMAFFLLTSIPLWFGMGQEIVAIYSPHDEYYFLLRAVSLKMGGSHLAPIKEILYPLFIRVSWLYGLGLRNFEVLCYGLSLFFLWGQILNLTRSRLIAWMTLLPLAFFSYQHAVFNLATYDALLLILLPLSFATSIYLYCKKASWISVVLAGIAAGLQVLTRPEGILFVLPPLVSLLFVWLQSSKKANYICSIRGFIVVLVIVFLSQQVASAINWRYFGFWAPTIMKSHSFQRCSSALMKIDPEAASKIHYAAVPKASLEKAYQVSPFFRRARPFISQNLDGHGWSGYANAGYRATDGSVSGGHFQWALLDAGASVAGPKAADMLMYFDSVADEINEGIKNGKIPSRRIFSTALGPDFSFFDRKFWSSLWLIGRYNLNLIFSNSPEIARVSPDTAVESDFDKVALRRTGLLENSKWQLEGWVVSPTRGIPDEITLDQEALDAGITLTLKERPDVARGMCGVDPDKVPQVNCGIEIASPGSWVGNLRVVTGDQVVLFPFGELMNLTPRVGFGKSDICLYIDKKTSCDSNFIHQLIGVTAGITRGVFYLVRLMIFGAFFLLAVILLLQRIPAFRNINLNPVFLAASLAASVTLPRLVLFAAIDANMYPGTESRYLAPGAFSVWLFAGFTVSYLIVSLFRSRKKIPA